MPNLEPILLCPDLHAPFHDKRAWRLMLKVAKDLRPRHIYTIGDFVDFYSVSSHSKDPNRVQFLEQELEVAHGLLDELDSLGAKHKTFLSGNHSSRLERYLQDKAPELFNIVTIPGVLELKKRGWNYVPYKSHVKLGKMHFTHDVGVAGRYSVFRCLDTYQHSVVSGHSHRFAYIVEGNAVGEFKLSVQFGWLGDAAKIDYMQSAKVLKDWALGFGVGYYNPSNGYVYMVPVPIVSYTCVVNGKLYSA